MIDFHVQGSGLLAELLLWGKGGGVVTGARAVKSPTQSLSVNFKYM